MAAPFDAAVVGGGVYGCVLALHLRRAGRSVVLFEQANALASRASFANQARVHNGYHYPRSFLTALRSRVNYPRFLAEYADCIAAAVPMHYAIARRGSSVSADQFVRFCARIGAELWPADDSIEQQLDRDMVEAVFAVRESVFDAERLAARLTRDLAHAGVEVRLGTRVEAVERLAEASDPVELRVHAGDAVERSRARVVLGCTYARTNQLLVGSGLPPLPLKHELAELVLLRPPEPLCAFGLTVMCGPFFSLLPFPPRRAHTLSHVRYTPHHEWVEPAQRVADPYLRLQRGTPPSRAVQMLQDARRYLPAIAGSEVVGSLFEIKTVLPESEVDDSRPILLRRSPELPQLITVMGSKIDNVYDLLEPLDALLAN
ncbi:MAG: FAD-binding oxidoreductase [Planctomycetes bacterium]|nr:FAD-binding oxidoreductase [Planctomycetota bacterium]